MEKNFTGWRTRGTEWLYFLNGQLYLTATTGEAKRYIEYLFDVGGTPVAGAMYVPVR